METKAIFSNDRLHRYALVRIWDDSKPKVMFIGINPSKADETENDNTIEKVIKISIHNGFGGLYMLNLYSFITSNPKNILFCKASQKVNNEYLYRYGQVASKIVMCYGNGTKRMDGRKREVMEMFPESYCLHINKNGSPKHPLYCLDVQEIIQYTHNYEYLNHQ